MKGLGGCLCVGVGELDVQCEGFFGVDCVRCDFVVQWELCFGCSSVSHIALVAERT